MVGFIRYSEIILGLENITLLLIFYTHLRDVTNTDTLYLADTKGSDKYCQA